MRRKHRPSTISYRGPHSAHKYAYSMCVNVRSLLLLHESTNFKTYTYLYRQMPRQQAATKIAFAQISCWHRIEKKETKKKTTKNVPHKWPCDASRIWHDVFLDIHTYTLHTHTHLISIRYLFWINILLSSLHSSHKIQWIIQQNSKNQTICAALEEPFSFLVYIIYSFPWNTKFNYNIEFRGKLHSMRFRNSNSLAWSRTVPTPT